MAQELGHQWQVKGEEEATWAGKKLQGSLHNPHRGRGLHRRCQRDEDDRKYTTKRGRVSGQIIDVRRRWQVSDNLRERDVCKRGQTAHCSDWRRWRSEAICFATSVHIWAERREWYSRTASTMHESSTS
jgi:hypothetical protein